MNSPVAANSPAAPEGAESSGTSALLLGGLIGVVVAILVVPPLFPALLQSLVGEQPKAFWYLSRSSALVAYSLSWIAMMAGLGMTTKYGNKLPFGFTGFDVHRTSSLLAVVVAAFHALVLLGDKHIGAGPWEIFVPFGTAGYRPIWVGIGQVSLYSMALISATFWARSSIGNAGWRLIHWATFLAFGGALVHAIAAGSDSGSVPVAVWYWVSGSAVLVLFNLRLVTLLRKRWSTPVAGNAAAA